MVSSILIIRSLIAFLSSLREFFFSFYENFFISKRRYFRQIFGPFLYTVDASEYPLYRLFGSILNSKYFGGLAFLAQCMRDAFQPNNTEQLQYSSIGSKKKKKKERSKTSREVGKRIYLKKKIFKQFTKSLSK